MILPSNQFLDKAATFNTISLRDAQLGQIYQTTGLQRHTQGGKI